MENNPKILQKFSTTDLSNLECLISLFKNSPIPYNEIFGTNNYRIIRSPFTAYSSYLIF